MATKKILPKATGDDDTEGHRRKVKLTGDDDTEGHRRKVKLTGDDDTEGQFMPNPEINRHLARAREEEIQRKLKLRENTLEARRPHVKKARP
jgi:hypothetical protein